MWTDRQIDEDNYLLDIKTNLLGSGFLITLISWTSEGKKSKCI